MAVALDMPLRPPFFFINGLVGGIGLNRDPILPSIDEVENHLLIQSLAVSPIRWMRWQALSHNSQSSTVHSGLHLV